MKQRRLRRRSKSNIDSKAEVEGFFSTHRKMLFLSFWTCLIALLMVIDYQADGVIEMKGAKVSGFVALSMVFVFCLFALISVMVTVKDILNIKSKGW
ncbi:hypothetical protein [Microbulbifer spongiae]|uniref:DUF485 domain-containing protein n=1 Tax=Microbulbifer spongiae TaxID=2944933 RepID=A0ABY9EI15_9GAMM|nr:hypothetical protein [Microbulbifer sp. MI-G]WKD50601.1 hypothetical protein M8T91_04015 [Microbulbifer sp. MI-G]